MSDLPIRLEGVRATWQQSRAVEAQRKTELEIFRRALHTRFLAECDRIDSEAIADVARHSLQEEMNVLDYGLQLAGDSLAKRELVARLSALQSRLDNERIARRFGGR